MRALLALAAFFAASPLRANDTGQQITFNGVPILQVLAHPSGTQSLELGPSDPLPEFENVLLNGKLEGVLSAEVSAQRADGSWGPWTAFVFHDYPNGRFWAKAVVGAGKGQVKLRLSGTALLKPITLFDLEASGMEAERPGRRPRGVQPKSEGQYLERSAWGAKPPKEPYAADEPWRVTVHHTDGSRPEKLADSIVEMRMLQDFHQNGRGWIDIGYHFLIDGAGRVFEGRPQTVLGAHTQRNNDGNLGISMMGHFTPGTPTSMTPNEAQQAALERILRFLMARFQIGPELLRGHRDYKSTDCPGDTLYAMLPALRDRLAQPAAPAPSPTLDVFRLEGGRYVPVILQAPLPRPAR